MMKKILTLCSITPAMLLASTIEVTLEHNRSNPNPLDITVKVTNTSDEDTFIEPSNYPYKSGNVARNLFTVLEDGEKVSYIGSIALVTPQPKKLIAGASYTSHINIKKLYKLNQGTHNYEIYYGHTEESNTLEIEATIIPHNYKQRNLAGYYGCSSNVMPVLLEDHSRAQSFAQNVVNTLPRVNRNHALYQKWFGYADPARYNAVYENYKKIYGGFNQNVTYTCNYHRCEAGYNAMVEPANPYNINICNNYWSNPDNIRAYTLVHEMSHFYAIAATVDGSERTGNNPYKHEDGAQNLARIRPDLAIHNAYSYGHYARELFIQGSGSNTGGQSSNSWTTGSYGNNIDTRRTLSVSQGRKVTVTVRGHLEQNYDFIYIYNRDGIVKRRLTGNIDTSFTVSGKSIVARLVTDSSNTSSGVTVKIKRKKDWWEFW